jgi:hypothetical protein
MAARALVVAVMDDGADRVHVVTGCGFGEVYGTADRPQRCRCIVCRMDRWLIVARGWYLLVSAGGLLAAAGGMAGEVAPTPAVIAASVGAFSLSASAWVRSDSVPRGMLASIGIPIGAVAVAAVAYLWAIVVDTLGVLPATLAYAVAVVPSAVAVAAAAIMWRSSSRPWDGPAAARGFPSTCAACMIRRCLDSGSGSRDPS